jgi:predicted ATPase
MWSRGIANVAEGSRRVVLTGGPGGGKSTFIDELHHDSDEWARWICVPEAAPLLFLAGLDGTSQSFQVAAFRLQIVLEDSLARAGKANQMLLCDRGTLDCLAYWCHNGWREADFFAQTITAQAHLDRYHAVLHLRTPTSGACPHYRCWSQARPESLAQAVEIDQLCASVWRGHPRYILIECTDDWRAKARMVRQVLTRIMVQPDL